MNESPCGCALRRRVGVPAGAAVGTLVYAMLAGRERPGLRALGRAWQAAGRPRAGPLRQRHLELPWKSVRISKTGVEVGTSGRVRVGWGYAAGRAGTSDD